MGRQATYTYAILDVSEQAFNEIKTKLLLADYQQAIHATPQGEIIDMHGIGLRAAGTEAVSSPRHLGTRKIPHVHQWVVQPGLLRFEGPDGQIGEIKADIEVCLFADCNATRDITKK